MTQYRIEGSHFIEYYERAASNDVERVYVNTWCADDECFRKLTDDIYSNKKATYIRAYHDATTDGHGNAWNGDEFVVPEYFSKTLSRYTAYVHIKPSNTNRTWLVVQEISNKDSSEVISLPLGYNGRYGKLSTKSLNNVAYSSESAAKNYCKKESKVHPGRKLRAISLIDFLEEYEEHNS